MAHALLRIAVLCLVLLSSIVQPASARDLNGPVEAVVERVIDGDTLRVRVRVWLDLELTVNVRLRGIDAPELRARCAAEQAGAEAARDFVTTLVDEAPVWLHRISGGKYHGRVIADVTVGDGRDLAAALLSAKLVRPYDGGRRAGWCEGTD
jgi:micrococcal nuclease